jgi:serine/threonine protein kinase/cytochrome c-type biogenesis protein CcmH/NrfG
MEAKQWQQVEDLFHEALQLGVEERAAYLAQVCSDNDLLRHEVESLVLAFEQSFMEQPVLSLGMMVLSDAPAESLVGRSIGQYKILRLLGQGGMGAVYLAEDCKLERPVALKFFKNTLSDDGQAREQLKQEARAVAKFEHSNICAVYGIEEIDGYDFIVMQFVEGETLASLLGHGRLELDEVFNLGEQILSALSTAEARGIIHRDIKPQNILVTADRQVKVLDFGLAKFIQPKLESIGDAAGSDAPHELVVGTIAYMSPEQLRAEALDYRSDIFSFGIVLYEMTSGVHPFKRDDKEQTILAIKENEPPRLKSLSPQIPDELECLVNKCLEKDREQRYQTAEPPLLALRDLRADYELARSHPWKRRVLHQRKNLKYYALAACVLTVLLGALGVSTYLRMTRVHTLSVLSMANGGGDQSLEYLSDGLSKSLIDKLSRLSKLRVRSSAAVSLYNEQNIDPVQAGRQLNAEAVLVGTLVKEHDGLQLQARLLKTADGSQVWAKTFNVKAAQILSARDEIARDVISNMDVWLSDAERSLLTKRETDNPEAQRLYMMGQFYWKRRNEDNIDLAIKSYEEATEIDPTYAQAWAGLAESYIFKSTPVYGAELTEKMIPKALFAAQQAIKLDSMLSEAYTSLGILRFRYYWDWKDAEKQFRQAIELNPDYAPAHFWYSNLLMTLARNDEAIRESEINQRLDPFSPNATVNLGRAYYYARQYEKAIAYYREVLERKPDDNSALYMLALAYLQKRMYPEAIALLKPLYSVRPLTWAAPLGFAYGKAGQKAEALDVIKKLDELSQKRHVPPQEKAIIYIGLNDRDKAFDYLEEAYRERFSALIGVAVDPLFDDLHSDPRFDELVRRLNLTL